MSYVGLHNQNDVETSTQWIPGYCDIPGNDRADKLAKQWTSKAQHDEHACLLRYIQADHTNEVSEDLACQVGSWQRWTDLLPAPTHSKPGKNPIRAHERDCHICLRTHHSPTAERTPTPHQERTPRKVCLLPHSDETVDHFLSHCPLYDKPEQDYCQPSNDTEHAIWIHYTTATNSHLQYASREQMWQDCPKSGDQINVLLLLLLRDKSVLLKTLQTETTFYQRDILWHFICN